MANPEQKTSLGAGDGELESVDSELLKGSTRSEERNCGTMSRVRTHSGRNEKRSVLIERRKPLNLLDLPVDVLKDIIKEVRDVVSSAPHSPVFY
jgi:hypothetical protein